MLCFGLGAQVVDDDFSDNDFTSNPTWSGDDAQFTVNALQQLQLNSTGTDQSYVSTSFSSTTLNNREWRFYVRQDFAGSASNQSRIYFASEGAASGYLGTGSASVTGYYLQIGEALSGDVVRVFKDNGATTTEIAVCTTNISSGADLGIKITRDNSANWQVMLDAAGGTNYILEASFSDNSYATASDFSFVCTYTSSNADAFFFDDIYFGDIVVDTAPPQLISATATSANTLDVLFDESVSTATCEVESNYEVFGFGSPSSALRDANNHALVHLTFANSFPENETQTLEVQNVEDEAGNLMAADNATFLWFVAVEPAYRSVVFNEVLADETPPVASTLAEFVELHNTSANAFDLSGWQFVNSSTVKVLPAFVLEPDSFVVLCDANDVSLFNNAIGITSFTALTNGGDSLTLLDAISNIIDVLVYTIDWYDTSEKANGGWSLEQVNPLFPCSNNSNNWSESVNTNGATPGSQNSVFSAAPDVSAPTIVAHGIADLMHIYIEFSEPIDTLGLNTDWSFIPFSGVSNPSWNGSLTIITLETQFALYPPGSWQLTVTGISDCSSNAMNSIVLQYWAGFAPEVGDLIINEIYPDETAADPPTNAPTNFNLPNGEYVELLNISDKVLDLKNVQLINGVIEEQYILFPDSFVVLADESNFFSFLGLGEKVVLMESFPLLTNSGMELQLLDANDNILDEVNYDMAWFGVSSKQTGQWALELINPNDPCSNADNWTASIDSTGGSPARRNSVYNDIPDPTAPQLLYVLSEPQESITLVFSEPLDEASLAGLSWTVNGEVQDNFNAQFTNSEGTSVVLYYGEMEAGVIYTFDLLGLSDCWGNDAGLLQNRFALPETPQAGDIIINEILSNPYEGGKDFIEIYNNSLRNLSLADWSIADVLANGTINPAKNIAQIQFMLFPGEYLALSEAGNELEQFYPGTAIDRILTVDVLPEFSAEDAVILITPSLAISDAVFYNDAAHFPLLNSFDGVSLERIAFSRPSADITNWHSASEFVGFATPGYQNSQSNNNFTTEQSFEVVNEIFSPDNDGYQDVVTFAYNLDERGYTGNITIYDSEGRPVRKLMQNDLLGISGSISWDGFSDDKQKASIGIYVVYFEVFNLKGDVSKFKKTCVVAHQLD